MIDLAHSAADDVRVAVYELPPESLDAQPVPDGHGQDNQRNRTLLQQNAIWFCRLRWIVAGVLTAAGLAACHPAWADRFGVLLLPAWLLISAGALGVANIVFVFTLGRWPADSPAGRLRVHLWCQILVDLIVLTAVVHSLGSYFTYAPVAYLFHIILACIFFPRWESLGVTLVSAALFGTLVVSETAGLLPRPQGLIDLATAVGVPGHAAWMWQGGSLLGIWAVIWYLASRLAGELRRRERELAAANRRLEASSTERAAHMLQTTHQLKAPFAAIHANTQLLLNGYAGSLSPESRTVIEKISSRACMLSRQIQEMLQLANLRSQAQTKPSLTVFELPGIIQREVERIEPQAALRGIAVENSLEPVRVRGSDDYLVMLIDNLLNNAINYSYDGGRVAVSCGRSDATTACVIIRDHGIGIPADKLPFVFQDYYRTTEATQHNKSSTGLGLAIVRLVAKALNATVRIESAPGWGTRVTLRMPAIADDVPSK